MIGVKPLPVLLVDDDAMVREALGQTLDLGGFRPVLATSFIEAKDHISTDFTGVIVSDIRMPGKDGFALLEYVRSIDDNLPVILLTGEGDVPTAVRGISEGAYDFLEKPCDPKHLLEVVGKAMQTRALVIENRRLKSELDLALQEKIGFLGMSEASFKLREAIRRAGQASSSVLISGPRGAGRGFVARLIQERRDARQDLRRIDCLSPFDFSILEKPGDEVLLLCDIDRLEAVDQLRLLQVLRERPENVYFATSGPDIEQYVQSGGMNDDLFYLLSVVRIQVPPLSDRREDIPLLFDKFLREEIDAGAQIASAQGRAAAQGLAGLDWSGNLMALRNHAKRVAWGLQIDSTETSLKTQMLRVERGIIEDALRRHTGHATDTAHALGMPRKTFYDRLAKLNIRAEDYRES